MGTTTGTGAGEHGVEGAIALDTQRGDKSLGVRTSVRNWVHWRPCWLTRGQKIRNRLMGKWQVIPVLVPRLDLNHIGPMHITAYFPILHCPLILTINIHPYHFPRAPILARRLRR